MLRSKWEEFPTSAVGGLCSVGRNGSPDPPPPPRAPAHLALGSAVTAPLGALEQIWAVAGGDPSGLERVGIIGDDPMLPTDIRIGTAAAGAIAATWLAASEIWRLRPGRGQAVGVGVPAAVPAFRSER